MRVAGIQETATEEWGDEVPVEVRYEDIAQDGRVKIDFLPHAMGVAGWRTLLRDHPIRQLTQEGVVPILNRIWICATDESVAVGPGISARARLELAHTPDEEGRPTRLLMHLYAEVFGVCGRTFGPPPPRAGERVKLGDLFAQHVFTRPFGPAEERRVLTLDHAGLPDIPPLEVQWSSAETLLSDAPENTVWHPPQQRRLGMGDTDSNQHVNSLVYPRIFEEAALDATREAPPTLLLREVELAFRRPTFAGDKVAVHMRTWGQGDTRFADGYLRDVEGENERAPHCTARLRLGAH